MKKNKKEKWNFMSVMTLVGTIGIVGLVLYNGKTVYQPYKEDEYFTAMEQRMIAENEMTLNYIKKDEIISEMSEEISKKNEKLLTLDKENKEVQLKVDTLYVYFKSLPYGAGSLDGTEREWVHYALKNGLDYIRPISISLHETYEWKDRGYGIGHGRSKAIKEQLNVSGINLTQRERNMMNVKGYTANLKTYQNVEESIMATCRKLKDYQSWYGAYTLSEIQKIYAPVTDSRSANNGGNYGDNTKWLKSTLKHYNAIKKIEDRLRSERGL